MKSNTFRFFICAALFAFNLSVQANVLDPHGPYYDSPNGGNPLASGQELFASGGDVTITFLGPTTAIYDDILFVATPANGLGQFFENHSTYNGTTVDLGNVDAGTEIEFGLYAYNSGQTWYDGPGGRNSDGQVHTYMVNNYEGLENTTYLGFEDLGATENSDWNYVDDIFAVTGVNAGNPNTVPEITSTVSLLGFSLCSLMTFRRYFKK
jgi:hypothetical protein